MPQAILLNSAEADLTEIWEYIAQDSPENASRFIRRIRETCTDALAYNPRMGRSRDELAPGLRSFTVQDYVILYRPIDDGVEIARVLHGSRDIEGLF